MTSDEAAAGRTPDFYGSLISRTECPLSRRIIMKTSLEELEALTGKRSFSLANVPLHWQTSPFTGKRSACVRWLLSEPLDLE